MEQNDDLIIGVDPGTTVTGYGIIQKANSFYRAVDFGCIRPPSSLKLTDRYLIIFEALEALLDQYKPKILAIETQFVQKNVQSAMKLGMARGVVIIAAKRRGIDVVEYTPSQAKKAVLGNGRASKHQVQAMVQRLLDLKYLPEPEDAADALALAICHANSKRYTMEKADCIEII